MARVETRESVDMVTKSRPAPEVSKGTTVPQFEAKARTPGARAFLPVNNQNAAKVHVVRFQLKNLPTSVPRLLQQSKMPTLPCLSKFTPSKEQAKTNPSKSHPKLPKPIEQLEPNVLVLLLAQWTKPPARIKEHDRVLNPADRLPGHDLRHVDLKRIEHVPLLGNHVRQIAKCR